MTSRMLPRVARAKMTWAKLALALVAVATAAPASAGSQGVEIGMSLSAVQGVYPRAKRLISQAGAALLELTNVDFAATHWEKVDLEFDRQNRVDRIQLITRAASYDEVRGRLVEGLDRPTGLGLRINDEEAFDRSVQLRLCDRGASGVYLTYERPAEPI